MSESQKQKVQWSMSNNVATLRVTTPDGKEWEIPIAMQVMRCFFNGYKENGLPEITVEGSWLLGMAARVDYHDATVAEINELRARVETLKQRNADAVVAAINGAIEDKVKS